MSSIMKIDQIKYSSELPLIVDMDGTYFRHDVFQFQLIRSLFLQPVVFIKAFILLLKGKKAESKHFLAEHEPVFEFDEWPTNQKLVNILQICVSNGRQVILCSGSNQRYVQQASFHSQLFQESYGSSESLNLTGRIKAKFLNEKFGEFQYDYVGNSKSDNAVYKHSANGYVTNAYWENSELPVTAKNKFDLLLKQFRVKHWSKNLLLFLPLISAHEYEYLFPWVSETIYFLLFSLVASATYLLNDVLDLRSDLSHETKRNRPIAQGFISPLVALTSAVTIISGCILISGVLISWGSSLLLVLYVLITWLYSTKAKKIAILDITVLATLYSLRVVSGAIVANLPQSIWLISFTFLLFYSMATVKRFVDLKDKLKNETISGRGYVGIDTETLAQIGVSAGISSVVVYALYVTSDHVESLYANPSGLLLSAPVILYWISYLWISARRGLVDADPIDWAIRDKISLLCGALFMLILIGNWLIGFSN